MKKGALYWIAFLQAFCSVAQSEQKAFFISAPDSFYTIQYFRFQNLYQKQNPQVPLYYDIPGKGECVFDGFGSNRIPEFICTCNNLDAARTIETQKLWPGSGYGFNLSGAGLDKLALWDGGAARTSHIEFNNRVMVMDSPSAMSAHTTAVAGNLAAFGINANVRGMSYETQLHNWNFSNDNAEIIGAAGGLLLSNHSYASTAAWTYVGSNLYWYGDSSLNRFKDWKFGYYDNRSRIWDSVMYANPFYLMVKAAGNDRGNGVAPGTPHYYWNGSAWALTNSTRDTVGPYDCISTFGNAKNLLTVGAVGLLPGGYSGPSSISMQPYSTWGPTDDGRIKPDLVAASGNVYSLGSAHDSAYAFLGGTSMAAPNITGSLLLLQQYYQILKGRYMRNASLKGLAIHTANRCNNDPGPDFECGWGLPNMQKAAVFLRDSVLNSLIETQLQNADTFYTDIFCSTNDSVRITLVWTDPHAIPLTPAYNDSTPRLINDLDVRLLNLSGVTLRMPFAPDPAHPTVAAGTGDNHRDNVEQIYWPGVTGGRYRIRVTHKGALQNVLPQKFSLLISGSPLYTPALPVGWLNGGAKQEAWNEVKVFWQTAWEKNNLKFEVEAGTDGLQFTTVGMVMPAAWQQNKISTYEFIHQNNQGFSGNWYYRIRQTDADGKINYSRIYQVETASEWAIKAIYPNPFSDDLNLDFYAEKEQPLSLDIYKMNGQLAYHETLKWGAGIKSLPLTSLPDGIYILFIKNEENGREYRQKIVKQN